ncbi:MAG: cobyrinate a,c-diamide synthase [Candidatus Rokuibacteriota bacterium]
MRVPRVLVLAGTASGVGKTTVTLGLLEALRRRGVVVQPFKVGPDFIDPGLHEVAAGRRCYNLDGWMCGREHVLETVAHRAADADLALVEGVMGCFDGVDGLSENGSTAQIAKWLGAPVVLVVDARAQSRSAAATVLGFERYDPDLPVAGVIFNRVGGDLHAQWLDEAVRAACQARPLGALRRDETIGLPERHLGLVTAVEGVLPAERRKRLAEVCETFVDLDALQRLAAPLDTPARLSGSRASAPLVRIGVARDPAFQFYYADNLDLLRAAGAELVFWSPLADHVLPDVDGLYFGGGYPELHAAGLGANVGIRAAVRTFGESGRPIYAECGGLMYLADALEDLQGEPHAMVGLLPTTVRMRPRRLTLGYTEVHFTADTPIGVAGAIARGHEFHYSTIDPVPERVPRAWRLERPRGESRSEGYLIRQVLMSYVHLHFASNPALATDLVQACQRARPTMRQCAATIREEHR